MANKKNAINVKYILNKDSQTIIAYSTPTIKKKQDNAYVGW
ncbi:MAG: hypothetical protein QX196_05235 [Methylococcaceae bacterium]